VPRGAGVVGVPLVSTGRVPFSGHEYSAEFIKTITPLAVDTLEVRYLCINGAAEAQASVF
jgi:hypothetical protein